VLGAVTKEDRLFNKNVASRKMETFSMASEFCPVPVPETPVQRDEGLVNGGPNCEALKVSYIALVKFGYMLETPSIPHYSTIRFKYTLM